MKLLLLTLACVFLGISAELNVTKTPVTRPKGSRPSSHDPNTWFDCAGEVNGTTSVDFCGTCGGHNESCTDCKGVVYGTARIDCTGKCGGNAKIDCAGVCGGKARKDCKGVCNGHARIDSCRVCGGNNECVDCLGVAYGSAKVDRCGVCNGDNACVDCAGVPHGTTKKDECGVCGGTNDCLDCNGVINGTAKVDRCGDCGGDGTRCLGCDGVPFSNKIVDRCGICGGNSTTCCGPKGKCSDNGQCDPRIKGCLCDLGWTGPHCSIMQDLCQFSNNDGSACGGHGRCNSGTGDCICEEGWSGDNCEFSTCSGHGVYDIHISKCTCFPGYSGSLCDTCTSHPNDKEGNPNLDVTFVCVLKDNAFYFDEHSKSLLYEAPLRFMLQAVETSRLNLVLNGAAYIAKTKKVILPGSEFNGHIYGCDCLPATPDPSVYKSIGEDSTEMDIIAYEGSFQNSLRTESGNVLTNGAPGKFYTEERVPQPRIITMDPLALKKVKPSDRFVHFKEELGESYLILRSYTNPEVFREMRAPANLAQLQSYVNDISDIFNLRIDAATDEAETVLSTVNDVENDMIFYQNYNLWATGAVFTMTTLFLGIALISLCGLKMYGSAENLKQLTKIITSA